MRAASRASHLPLIIKGLNASHPSECAISHDASRDGERIVAHESAILLWPRRRDSRLMSKRRRPSKSSPMRTATNLSQRGILPDDLYDFAAPAARRSGRPPAHDLSAWTVIDDWPERVPVTQREVDVFEAWFGDILDELLGPI
jgi:hypothetical protein